MKTCERGKGNLIGVAIILICFVGLAGFSIYGIVTKDTAHSILGGQYETQYGTAVMDEKMLYSSAAIMIGVTIYLFWHVSRTIHSKVCYDNNKVIFYIDKRDIRQFSWHELKQPRIKIEWVITDKVYKGNILSFTFEDKKKVAVSKAYKGFKELCKMLTEKGIVI